MSIASWKAEFYPVSAKKVPKSQALAHSLRKWIGLRSENLKRHGLKACFAAIYPLRRRPGRKFRYLRINSASCALCVHYYDEDKTDPQQTCLRCPLYAVCGCPCDRDSPTAASPFHSWTVRHDPEPMIRLLQAALEQQQKTETVQDE